MRRAIVYLFIAAAILVVARLLAPIIVLGALALVVVAARWPQILARPMRHPVIQGLPAVLRATPMRLAATVAVASIAIAATAFAIAPPSATGDDTVGAEPSEAPRATPRATVQATPAAIATPTLAPAISPTPTPTPAPTPVFGRAPTGPTEVATVASVTDGDTIRVLLDGQNLPVRYIGIDTPETQGGVEWMGREATAANAELVAERRVVLEKDVSETDRFGRLLRHVWIETDAGWLLVSAELLRLGVAEVTTFPPDVKYIDEVFLPAQQAARAAGIGLWGAPPATPAAIVPLVPQQEDCEPSYPDVCIPIGSVDLDCPDIEARRFTVLWGVPNPDPHRFDGNSDGVGCESG